MVVRIRDYYFFPLCFTAMPPIFSQWHSMVFEIRRLSPINMIFNIFLSLSTVQLVNQMWGAGAWAFWPAGPPRRLLIWWNISCSEFLQHLPQQKEALSWAGSCACACLWRTKKQKEEISEPLLDTVHPPKPEPAGGGNSPAARDGGHGRGESPPPPFRPLRWSPPFAWPPASSLACTSAPASF